MKDAFDYIKLGFEYDNIERAMNERATMNELTKREYFAAMAMQGILANPEFSHIIDTMVNHSLDIADALIAKMNTWKCETCGACFTGDQKYTKCLGCTVRGKE